MEQGKHAGLGWLEGWLCPRAARLPPRRAASPNPARRPLARLRAACTLARGHGGIWAGGAQRTGSTLQGLPGPQRRCPPAFLVSPGASRDPPEKQAPMCTLHSFPHSIHHCLTYARWVGCGACLLARGAVGGCRCVLVGACWAMLGAAECAPPRAASPNQPATAPAPPVRPPPARPPPFPHTRRSTPTPTPPPCHTQPSPPTHHMALQLRVRGHPGEDARRGQCLSGRPRQVHQQ